MAFSSSSSSTRGPEHVRGEMFFFGSLTFVADDSAWLAESPLQAQLLPPRGSVHFRVDGSGALRLQLPVQRQVQASLSLSQEEVLGTSTRSSRQQAAGDTTSSSHRFTRVSATGS